MTFRKIGQYKKITRCIYCGKKIIITNFNQKKCEECGYHERERTKNQQLDEDTVSNN